MPCSSPRTDLKAALLQNPMLRKPEHSYRPPWSRTLMFPSNEPSSNMPLPSFWESLRRRSLSHHRHSTSNLRAFRPDSPHNFLSGGRTSPLRSVGLQNRTNKSELPVLPSFQRSS